MGMDEYLEQFGWLEEMMAAAIYDEKTKNEESESYSD